MDEKLLDIKGLVEEGKGFEPSERVDPVQRFSNSSDRTYHE